MRVYGFFYLFFCNTVLLVTFYFTLFYLLIVFIFVVLLLLILHNAACTFKILGISGILGYLPANRLSCICNHFWVVLHYYVNNHAISLKNNALFDYATKVQKKSNLKLDFRFIRDISRWSENRWLQRNNFEICLKYLWNIFDIHAPLQYFLVC